MNVRKNGGLTVALSVQDENSQAFGIDSNGRVDRKARAGIFDKIQATLAKLGFADILSNPKHGTLDLPGATLTDRSRIRLTLLSLERKMGGIGLMPPSSTYHRFVVGMTGDKMSSSKPETTIFLDDSIDVMSKKVKRAFSGGQATIEEHRRLGGDLTKDVAFQYLQYFFESDDDELASIGREYQSGRMLAGEIKQLCIDGATTWLEDLAEKRVTWEDRLDEFLADDAL